MKTRIESLLPKDKHIIQISSATNLYIADYKHDKKYKNKGVVLTEDEPENIKTVYIINKNQVTVCFDGFKDNALPISKGLHNKQCECVLFPNRCNDDDWVLFVETKYANDIESAFLETHDYPNGMTEQIIKTVEYFREKSIISKGKKVWAIVSFPNLIEEFNSTIFKGNLSIEDILFRYKIQIRGTNSAAIISENQINLIS